VVSIQSDQNRSDREPPSGNPKRRQFAAYFDAIKTQVRAKWAPAEPYRNLDPDGRKFGQKDRYTLLGVELEPAGDLRRVVVELPSGVDLLDHLAMLAFREAAPFPSAPPPLVIDGVVKFRFGFFFAPKGR
jgi:hypothetical protein